MTPQEEERHRCIVAISEALAEPTAQAWRAFIDGPGGKTEALRQGKYEGMDNARRIAINAINRLRDS